MEREYNTDEFFMRAAISQALMALEKGEVPIGAVITHGNAVIGRGHNLVETLGDATAHAEMQAFTAAMQAAGGKYLPDCTLYVTVEPCIMCAGAAAWSQVGRIVYGAPDPKRGYSTVTGNILHPKTKVQGGVLGEECGTLMKEFFDKLRR